MIRICIKNASFKLLLLCFSCFNSLFASHFFKNVLPAYTGSMILQNDFKQFQSKFSLFWPPNGLHKSYFCHFCSLLSSLGSFGSLFFRSVPPSKFWLWPMTCAFLASRALSAKMTVCIAPLILQNSYAIYNFLCAIHDSSTFFYKTSTIFQKYAPRSRWEAWFWKRHKSKIMKNMPLRPFNDACMHPFCTTYCGLKFANSIGKMYIFRL